MPRICQCGVVFALARLMDLVGPRCFHFKPCGGDRGFQFCCRPRPCNPRRATCPSTRPLPILPTIATPQPCPHGRLPMRFATAPPWGVCLHLFQRELACGVPVRVSNSVCFFPISHRLILRAVVPLCQSISRQPLFHPLSTSLTMRPFCPVVVGADHHHGHHRRQARPSTFGRASTPPKGGKEGLLR